MITGCSTGLGRDAVSRIRAELKGPVWGMG
jgi:hypothetical protein